MRLRERSWDRMSPRLDHCLSVMMMCRAGIGGRQLSQTLRARPMRERFFPRDDHFMRLALREAERAPAHEDVPIGAVLVSEGEVAAAAHNERELRQDPTAHAEIIALREAARRAGSWRLLDAAIYVTLEPCAMCAGAIVLARVARGRLRRERPQGGGMRKRAGCALGAAPQPSPRCRRRLARGRLRSAVERVLRVAAVTTGSAPRPSVLGRRASRLSRQMI